MKFNSLFRSWNYNLDNTKFHKFSEIWIDDSLEPEYAWLVVVMFLKDNLKFETEMMYFFKNKGQGNFSLIPKPNFVNLLNKMSQLNLDEVYVGFKFYKDPISKVFHVKSNKLSLVKRILDVDQSFFKNPTSTAIHQLFCELLNKDLYKVFNILLNFNNPNVRFLNTMDDPAIGMKLVISIESKVSSDQEISESKEVLRYKELVDGIK